MDIICIPGSLFDHFPYTNRQRIMLELASRGHRILYVEAAKYALLQLAKALLGRTPEQMTDRKSVV